MEVEEALVVLFYYLLVVPFTTKVLSLPEEAMVGSPIGRLVMVVEEGQEEESPCMRSQ